MSEHIKCQYHMSSQNNKSANLNSYRADIRHKNTIKIEQQQIKRKLLMGLLGELNLIDPAKHVQPKRRYLP